MRTEKLYYEQSYETNFAAKIIAVHKENSKFIIALDRTLFYPEGGGQPCDMGRLGGFAVWDVQEDGELIWHTMAVKQNEHNLNVGENVEGQIDFERRFNFMQNHTGEHILSGLFKSRFGLDNVGFHMGSEAVTLDMNGLLSPEDILLAEKEANEAVYKNIAVKAFFPKTEELKKMNYRSKKELSGEVRIVSIGEYDSCACCGIHCRATGEIGLIKIISAQKYKKGTRLSLLCGHDALNDYIIKNKAAYEISALLSVPPYETAQAAKNMLAENSALKQKLAEAKKEIYERRAKEIPEGTERIIVFEKHMEAYEQRQLAMALSTRAGVAFVFSAGGEEEIFKYALASKSCDVKPIAALLNKTFDGKGGGSAELVQGTLHGQEEKIKDMLDEMLLSE